MRLYIGDLRRRDVISCIYKSMNEYFENYYNMTLPELDDDKLDKLSKNIRISTINGLMIGLYFIGDYVEFRDSIASYIIGALYNYKRLSGIIDFNDPVVSIINNNNEEINKIRQKISENSQKIQSFGYSPNDISIMRFKAKKIIKNNYSDNIAFTCYNLWKENYELTYKIAMLEQDNREKMIELINNEQPIALKKMMY